MALDVTDATFARDVIEASRTQPVVVDFWAGWCAPCVALAPLLDAAVEKHGNVTLAKVDVDANPQISAQFGIRGIPAVKGFRDGAVVAEFVGLQPRNAIDRFLEQLQPLTAAARDLPADEDGLRAALDEDAENATARRVLARLLIDSGRVDDAAELLEREGLDSACDGLRAEVEILRSDDAATLHNLGPARDLSGLTALIDAVRTASDPLRARLRRMIIGIIETEKTAHPEAETYRGQLASALF